MTKESAGGDSDHAPKTGEKPRHAANVAKHSDYADYKKDVRYMNDEKVTAKIVK